MKLPSHSTIYQREEAQRQKSFDTGKCAQPLTPFPRLGAAFSTVAANRWSMPIKEEMAEEEDGDEQEEAAGLFNLGSAGTRADCEPFAPAQIYSQ